MKRKRLLTIGATGILAVFLVLGCSSRSNSMVRGPLKTIETPSTTVYTLDGSISSGNTYYATEKTITQNDIIWKATGSTNSNPWRIGGQQIENVDRAIYSTTPISSDVAVVEVSSGAISFTENSNKRINSLTITVHSSASDAESGDNAIAIKTEADSSKIISSTVVLEKEDTLNWSNKYYRIVYNVTNTTKTNESIEFLSAVFSTAVGGQTPTRVNLYEDDSLLVVGDSKSLTATLSPAGADGTINWLSSDTDIVTVDDGEITGIASGTAIITAFIDENGDGVVNGGELNDTCGVKVILSLSLNKYSLEIDEGEMFTLVATIDQVGAIATISWLSEDEDIARVDSSGKVTGVEVGTTTVTAFIDDNDNGLVDENEAKAECNVSVNRVVKTTNTTLFVADLTSTMSVGAGYTISKANTSEQTGFYQDSGTNGSSVNSFTVKGSSPLFIFEPTEIRLSVCLATGTVKDPMDNSVQACLVDSSGKEIDSTTVVVASALTKDPTNYYALIPYSANAYGLKIKHLKEAGYSTRYYCFELSYQYTNSIATIHGVETTENETLNVDSVALRFGARISVANWGLIASELGTISDYGVMLFKKASLLNVYSNSPVKDAYRTGQTLAVSRRGSGAAPYLDGDDYVFTVKIKIDGPSSYGTVFCAAPFIVAGGDYYFLDEVQYSVNTLAQYYLVHGGSELSSDALSLLAGE